ncbi:hypothetical protein G7092_25350 [Mucilaginibacter sp. HC2]|uniref:hypothetical protein n=1 Tax=Mucilaginibacter inviolabilis TaxID=2714892 RepID=UPI001407CB9C|nr:hypothetical protein [Mucilaginibacter inviolabilis]NHA07150.1 hypothetical protein [Mucilaginibacter inviolabilis]
MKNLSLALVLTFFSLQGFSQFKVGKTQDQVKADEAKKTPVLIGAKRVALTVTFGLFHIEEDNSEFLEYHTTTNFVKRLEFPSVQEESDFYKYVLGLYDSFKDNEVTLGKTTIVPLRNNLLGENSLFFEIHPDPDNKRYILTTLSIGKKGWVKLFEKSRIQNSK